MKLLMQSSVWVHKFAGPISENSLPLQKKSLEG